MIIGLSSLSKEELVGALSKAMNQISKLVDENKKHAEDLKKMKVSAEVGAEDVRKDTSR